jgi:uncharacterized protein (TIGR03435 family)
MKQAFTIRFWAGISALLLLPLGAHAQSPEFEVASIHRSQLTGLLENYTPTLNFEPGATIRFSNLRLRDMIVLAYGVGLRQLGGPPWTTEPDTNDTPRFDVMAKVPAGAKKDEIPSMMQKLLADRFKLRIHREPRTSQVYVLQVAKGGHTLVESEKSTAHNPGCQRGFGPGPELSIVADCHNVTMAQLAQQIQALAPGYFRDGPVVDRTGLSGTYDLKLEWIRVQESEAGMSGPTMFAAVQKFGLRLERQKETVEMIIVDQCEQMPTEN